MTRRTSARSRSSAGGICRRWPALFVQVLKLAEKAGLVKLGHVALDGTKIKANASKHKAMSYERMKKREAELKAEVDRWLKAAEAADAEEDKLYGSKRGDEMPDWVADKQKRLENIRAAKAELEAEAKAAAEEEVRRRKQAEQKRIARRPQDEWQDAFAAEPGARRQDATQLHRSAKPHPQDQGRLHPGLQRAGRGRRQGADHRGVYARQQRQRPSAVRALARRHQGQSQAQSGRDTGGRGLLLGGQSAHPWPAADQGYIATGRHKHGAKSATTSRPAKPGSLLARMSARLKRAGHRSRYRLRKQVVGPVFGQIKQARGVPPVPAARDRESNGRMGNDLHRPQPHQARSSLMNWLSFIKQPNPIAIRTRP